MRKLIFILWDNIIPISVLFWFLTTVIYMLFGVGIPQPEGLTEHQKFAAAKSECFFWCSIYITFLLVYLGSYLNAITYTDRLFSIAGIGQSIGFLALHGFLINKDLHTQIDIVNSELGSFLFSLGILLLSLTTGVLLIKRKYNEKKMV